MVFFMESMVITPDEYLIVRRFGRSGPHTLPARMVFHTICYTGTCNKFATPATKDMNASACSLISRVNRGSSMSIMCKIKKSCCATQGLCVHEKIMFLFVILMVTAAIVHWGLR